MPSTLNPSPFTSGRPPITGGGVRITHPDEQSRIAARAAEATANAALAFAPDVATASGLNGLQWTYRDTTIIGQIPRPLRSQTVTLEPSETNYVEYSPSASGGPGAVTVNQSGFTGGATLSLYEVVTGADGILSFTDRREWLESNGTETVLISDTTKPTFASASINAAGDELTVNLTETDSPPILPATDIEGFTLGGVTGRSIGNGTRSDNDTITFSIAGGVVYSGESPTVEYTPGNVTDSASEPNAMDAFGAQAVTNNSEEEEPGGGENIAVGGTASASTTYATFNAARAFDGNAGTEWLGNSGGGDWLKYDLGAGNEAVAKGYTVLGVGGGTNTPMAWTFEGSNDDSDWDVLDTRSGQDTSTLQTYSFSNSTAYRYYRLNGITTGVGGNPPGVLEVTITN